MSKLKFVSPKYAVLLLVYSLLLTEGAKALETRKTDSTGSPTAIERLDMSVPGSAFRGSLTLAQGTVTQNVLPNELQPAVEEVKSWFRHPIARLIFIGLGALGWAYLAVQIRSWLFVKESGVNEYLNCGNNNNGDVTFGGGAENSANNNNGSHVVIEGGSKNCGNNNKGSNVVIKGGAEDSGNNNKGSDVVINGGAENSGNNNKGATVIINGRAKNSGNNNKGKILVNNGDAKNWGNDNKEAHVVIEDEVKNSANRPEDEDVRVSSDDTEQVTTDQKPDQK